MTRQSVIRKFAYISREWFHTYIWKWEKKALTPYGFDLISGSYTANRLMLTGKFEEQEVAISKSLLNDASVFVDIGANIGFYTCLALNLGKKVMSVEPVSKVSDEVEVVPPKCKITPFLEGRVSPRPFCQDFCNWLS